MKTPDFDKLREVAAALESHKQAGTLTAAVFDDLLDRADQAAAEHDELLEFVWNEAGHVAAVEETMPATDAELLTRRDELVKAAEIEDDAARAHALNNELNAVLGRLKTNRRSR